MLNRIRDNRLEAEASVMISPMLVGYNYKINGLAVKITTTFEKQDKTIKTVFSNLLSKDYNIALKTRALPKKTVLYIPATSYSYGLTYTFNWNIKKRKPVIKLKKSSNPNAILINLKTKADGKIRVYHGEKRVGPVSTTSNYKTGYDEIKIRGKYKESKKYKFRVRFVSSYTIYSNVNVYKKLKIVAKKKTKKHSWLL